MIDMNKIRGLARIWWEFEGWIVEVELLKLMVGGATASLAIAEMISLIDDVVSDKELQAGSPLVTSLHNMNDLELLEALFGRSFPKTHLDKENDDETLSITVRLMADILAKSEGLVNVTFKPDFLYEVADALEVYEILSNGGL